MQDRPNHYPPDSHRFHKRYHLNDRPNKPPLLSTPNAMGRCYNQPSGYPMQNQPSGYPMHNRPSSSYPMHNQPNTGDAMHNRPSGYPMNNDRDKRPATSLGSSSYCAQHQPSAEIPLDNSTTGNFVQGLCLGPWLQNRTPPID